MSMHYAAIDTAVCQPVSVSQDAGGRDVAGDLAAAILLREVEGLVREGQPRKAIAHIVLMTGVERSIAADFVSELQARLFA